jgi:uncharacterized membrane protein YdbT with pleckstrin-like domain
VAYPENLLAPGEEVVLHERPHAKKLIGPTVILLLTIGVAAFLAVLAAGLPFHGAAQLVIAILALIVVCWRFLAPVLRWRTTHFILTNARVMSREGLVRRTGVDIPLSRITSVSFHHGIVDRMFGCGTLVMVSASEEPLEFDDIPHVEHVHTVLYREVTENNPYGDANPTHRRRW